MKQVIEGKIYNTDTATEVASYCYGNPGDFEYEAETLYLTGKGNWFLYGEGGAKSKYSVSTGQNWWSGSNSIMPLTADQTKKWLEEHKQTEALLLHFGAILEDA